MLAEILVLFGSAWVCRFRAHRMKSLQVGVICDTNVCLLNQILNCQKLT